VTKTAFSLDCAERKARPVPVEPLDLCAVTRELQQLATALSPEQRTVIDRAQLLLSRQGAALTDIHRVMMASRTQEKCG